MYCVYKKHNGKATPPYKINQIRGRTNMHDTNRTIKPLCHSWNSFHLETNYVFYYSCYNLLLNNIKKWLTGTASGPGGHTSPCPVQKCQQACSKRCGNSFHRRLGGPHGTFLVDTRWFWLLLLQDWVETVLVMTARYTKWKTSIQTFFSTLKLRFSLLLIVILLFLLSSCNTSFFCSCFQVKRYYWNYNQLKL